MNLSDQPRRDRPIAKPCIEKSHNGGKFTIYWLEEVVKPKLAPGTYGTYEAG